MGGVGGGSRPRRAVDGDYDGALLAAVPLAMPHASDAMRWTLGFCHLIPSSHPVIPSRHLIPRRAMSDGFIDTKCKMLGPRQHYLAQRVVRSVAWPAQM